MLWVGTHSPIINLKPNSLLVNSNYDKNFENSFNFMQLNHVKMHLFISKNFASGQPLKSCPRNKKAYLYKETLTDNFVLLLKSF